MIAEKKNKSTHLGGREFFFYKIGQIRAIRGVRSSLTVTFIIAARDVITLHQRSLMLSRHHQRLPPKVRFAHLIYMTSCTLLFVTTFRSILRHHRLLYSDLCTLLLTCSFISDRRLLFLISLAVLPIPSITFTAHVHSLPVIRHCSPLT